MSKNKIAKRSKLKPFLKVINFNHVMPTRYAILPFNRGYLSSNSYTFDAGLDKAIVAKTALKEPVIFFNSIPISNSFISGWPQEGTN
jgi:hypothetical protein